MATITDIKSFKLALNGFIKSSKTQRDNLQDLLVYGFHKYSESGNTGELSAVVNALNSVRTIPTRTVQDYIKAFANVKLTKTKEGEFIFRKDGSGQDCPPVVKELTVTWYEWAGNDKNNAKADLVDPVAILKSAMIKIKEAIDSGKIVEGRDEIANDWLSRLTDVGNYEAIKAKDLKAMSAPVVATI